MGNNSSNKQEEKIATSQNKPNPNASIIENRISNINNDLNINDETSKMKQSLKYLHKNNFVSLTFVNINIYLIIYFS